MLAEETRVPPTVREAYEHCRGIALGHYENFPVVSWLLPRALRPHMYALYAYCRGVDDLGDEAAGDRMALLDEWEEELRRCYGSAPRDIRFVALQATARERDLPIEPFLRLIEANRRDQRVHRYETYEELLDYCACSANPVGELVLRIFGYTDEERRRFSDATCTALQLTNFWQDVARDWQSGRLYLPREDLQAFGVGEDDIAAGRATPEFRRLMAFEVARTRALFGEGLALPPLVSGRLRVDLRLFSLGGLAVLEAIERADYDVLSRRPTLSKGKKLRIALRGLLPLVVRGTA